jgi:RNA polymerase sigma factor (sigma-70 family)
VHRQVLARLEEDRRHEGYLRMPAARQHRQPATGGIDAELLAHGGLIRYQGDEATALAYTYKIARNKCLSFLKQKAHYINMEPERFNCIPEKTANANETDYTVLKNAISALPPRLAAVIQLQYYEKMSYKEISATLGISIKAVESLLVRAKRTLRKKILQDKES